MNSVQIIQCAIAVYLASLGLMMNTPNFMSAMIFKVIPVVSAFVLGLIAFGVIV